MTWGIIAGEYPPQPGGVSDYTWRVARALAAEGDDVHVFAPACDRPERPSEVRVHRLRGGYGIRELLRLRAELERLPKPRRLLLQFVVQSYGMRAMNVAFGLWVRTLRGFPLWVMFHEYAIADAPAASFPRRLQAWVTRRIAAAVARGSSLSFYGTAEWRPLLEAAAPDVPCRWLPVPSNISVEVDPEAVRAARASFAFGDATTIGHFGTYRMREAVDFLHTVFVRLADERPQYAFVLLGRGSTEFAARLEAAGIARARLFASGTASEDSVAASIAACDVLVQPYPEGVTTRRGSVMAGLALGIPIVTTAGPDTEALWEGALALAPFDVDATLARTIALVEDAGARARLAARARALYRESFALERLVGTLRALDREEALA